MPPKFSLMGTLLWLSLVLQEGSSFSAPQHRSRVNAPKPTVTGTHLLARFHDDVDPSPLVGRREWTNEAFASLFAASAVIWGGSQPQRASAADNGGDVIWKTGKAPVVPGQKPKDKGDVKGTKKDPSFLRSVSDCRSQCENTRSPDGLARTSSECLSACQDICCTTYEQCTFAIVPR
ncbi:hypothetical protein ACHAWF_000467 [Thalassiosira exigua]